MSVFDILRAKMEAEKNNNPSLMEQATYWRNGIDSAIEIVNQVELEFGNPTIYYLGSPCEYQTEDVNHNNGWIPCSERLPEKNKPVLCWVRSTTIASGETFIIGSCDHGCWFLQTYEIGHHHFPVKDYEVVAWQTLPGTYELDGE